MKFYANKNFNGAASKFRGVEALVLRLRQDDPGKCTAAKLAKFGLATAVGSPRNDSLTLNPFSHAPVLAGDALVASSVCAIDCSWEKADDVLRRRKYLLK